MGSLGAGNNMWYSTYSTNARTQQVESDKKKIVYYFIMCSTVIMRG